MAKEEQAKAAGLYFGMLSEMGLTKHMGGKEATNKLIRMCRIGKDSHVLDIGCGVGKTACYLAEKIGCRVTGIDLSKGMVKWAKQRAEKKGLTELIDFRVADAQNLPFKNNEFDAVICESVAAFFPDKLKGVKEFVRVVKPGCFIGLNEVTWIGKPTQKVIDYAEQIMGARFLSEAEWKELLVKTKLKEVKASSEKLNPLKQFKAELSWLEAGDFFRPWHKVIMLFIKNKKYRSYLLKMLHTPWSIKRFMGYGTYVGKK